MNTKCSCEVLGTEALSNKFSNVLTTLDHFVMLFNLEYFFIYRVEKRIVTNFFMLVEKLHFGSLSSSICLLMHD